jgi:hypothetical protein
MVSAPASKVGGKIWGQDPYSKELRPVNKWIRNKTGQMGSGFGRRLDAITSFVVGKGPAEFEQGTKRGQLRERREQEARDNERARAATAGFNAGTTQNRPEGVEGPEEPPRTS